MNKVIKVFTMLLVVLFPVILHAVEYNCPVKKKMNIKYEYTTDHILKEQPSVRIIENGSDTYISRCSFVQSKSKVTCDRYKVDRVETDSFVKHKKYYYFNGQFDVQIFSNLEFLENNGRGNISFGKCSVIAP